MSVNKSTLLRAIAQDAVYGLRNKRGTLIDQMATRHTAQSVKGSIPIYKTKSMLPSLDSNAELGSKLRNSFQDDNFEMGSADYELLNFYGKLSMDKAELRDLEQYARDVNPAIEKVMSHADQKLDRYARAKLASTTLNESEAVNNGAWNVDNSTPSLDIQEAANKTPGADIAVVGLDIAQILGRHPDFKEARSHYSGGGFSSFQAVREGVSQLTGIDPNNVYIGESIYNSANLGQTLTLGYSYAGLFWIGHREGLCLVEQGYEDGETPNHGELSIEFSENIVNYSYFRAVDVVRAEKELGCVITGVK